VAAAQHRLSWRLGSGRRLRSGRRLGWARKLGKAPHLRLDLVARRQRKRHAAAEEGGSSCLCVAATALCLLFRLLLRVGNLLLQLRSGLANRLGQRPRYLRQPKDVADEHADGAVPAEQAARPVLSLCTPIKERVRQASSTSSMTSLMSPYVGAEVASVPPEATTAPVAPENIKLSRRMSSASSTF